MKRGFLYYSVRISLLIAICILAVIIVDSCDKDKYELASISKGIVYSTAGIS